MKEEEEENKRPVKMRRSQSVSQFIFVRWMKKEEVKCARVLQEKEKKEKEQREGDDR